jgi:uncharacterized protein YggE
MKTYLLGIVTGILFFIFFGGNLPYPISPFNQPTITTSGRAEGTGDNTEASFYLTIRNQAGDNQAASELTNTEMAKLTSALKDFGIKSESMQTESINTYETYSYKQGADQILIYPPRDRDRGEKVWEASQSLSLKLNDLSRLDELTAKIQSYDRVELSGPNFTLDETKLETEILAQAVADARAKAEAMVQANGQKLGKISSISDFGAYPRPYYGGSEAMTKDLAISVSAPTLEPGATELVREVQVTFFIR